MLELGWSATPEPPELDPKIPLSLVPRHTWERPRNNGREAFLDRFFLCSLCSQPSVVRDPHATTPMYCPATRGGPMGFNSRRTIEQHLKREHCLAPPPTEPPPAAAPPAEADTSGAPSPAEAAAAVAPVVCKRCTFSNRPGARHCQMCHTALVGGSRRQAAMLEGQATKEAEAPPADITGSGDGHIDLGRPLSVTQLAGQKYTV
eukprot:5631623-Prymnesium_polylepis.1